MNFTLSYRKRHTPLNDLKFEIEYHSKEYREKQQRHKKRLATSVSKMKYLDRVVLLDGCTYRVENVEKKAFSTLIEALEYCRKLHPDRVKKVFGNSIRIFIENPNGLDIFHEDLIPSGLLVKDCKDALCVYAKQRVITVAADLSEVYTEIYDLDDTEYSGHNFIFDYGLLYGDYPVYTGIELCLSRLAEPGENVPFVPEISSSIAKPSAVYDHLEDVELAYHCWYVCMEDDGTVNDDHDGAYPYAAVPVSTFVNIGKAGVYWPCWDKIKGGLRWHKFWFNAGEKKDLFRFALLACKSQEIPAEQECYKMTVSYDDADGLLPTDAAGLSLRDSRKKLFTHAKERTIYIAPSFDTIYWETFELLDAAGKIHRFCFDYALLEPGIPEIAAGGTYKTSYWSKARWGNPLINAEVTICTAPDPGEVYSGHGDIALCYECRLKHNPGTVHRIPASTLSSGNIA